MKINLSIGGTIQPQIVDENTTVGALLRRPAVKAALGVPDKFQPVVNGAIVTDGTVLRDNDAVSYQPVAAEKATDNTEGTEADKATEPTETTDTPATEESKAE